MNLTHADVQGAAVLAGLFLVTVGMGLVNPALAVVTVGAGLIWYGRRTP